MSRNFEVLTQIESEESVRAGGFAEAGKVRARVEARVPRHYANSVFANSAASEEIVRLVQRVFLCANGNAPRQVLFFGVDENSGSSEVCARAGRALAERSSRSVCLVDANQQSHRLSNLLGIDFPAGMKAANDPRVGGAAARPLVSDVENASSRPVQVGGNLWLAGPALLAGAAGIAEVNGLKDRLGRIGAKFEYLLIDVAGANVRGDAAVLGQAADAAILVIEAHETRRVAARKAKETLEAANVRLLGTVLHNRTFPVPDRLYRKL